MPIFAHFSAKSLKLPPTLIIRDVGSLNFPIKFQDLISKFNSLTNNDLVNIHPDTVLITTRFLYKLMFKIWKIGLCLAFTRS